MAKVVKIIKTLRNNWKKSIFGAVALTYGIKYGISSYEHKQMMRAYCEAAKEIGEAPLPVEMRPRHITVILNPAANKRKAKKEFEEYCAPLLHLAGLCVNLLVTSKEGQARTLVEKLEETTDAIVVAGGDGTLSEAVTGLLRREDGTKVVRQIPFGVIPLGKTNSLARHIFSKSADDHIQHLAEATMAIIFEVTKPLDVLKFQVIPTEMGESGKPVFGLVGMQWGAYRDACVRQDKYWYLGGLRSYASYLFTGLKSEKNGVTWQVKTELKYTPPCSGCSNCINQRIDLKPEKAANKSWWSVFGKREPSAPVVDYRTKVNEQCSKTHQENLVTTEVSISSSNVLEKSEEEVPQLQVSYGPEQVTYEEFVKEGWRRVNGEEPTFLKSLAAKEVELWPKDSPSSSNDLSRPQESESESNPSKLQEEWMSIDSEDYEVKPVRITLLPNIIKMYCSPKSKIN